MDIDSLDESESFQRPVRGHKRCPKCGKLYNNNAIPERCTAEGCDRYLGGKAKTKPPKEQLAQLITSTIASVRLRTGGFPVRVFVDLKENKVK